MLDKFTSQMNYFAERFRRETSPTGNCLAKYFSRNRSLEKFRENNFTEFFSLEIGLNEAMMITGNKDCFSFILLSS